MFAHAHKKGNTTMPIEYIEWFLMKLFNMASEVNFNFNEHTFDWFNQWYLALDGPAICGYPDLNHIHQAQFVVAYFLNLVGWVLTGSFEIVPMIGYGGCGQ